MRLTRFIFLLLGGLLVLGIYGCNTTESDSLTPAATPATEMADDHADHDHAVHDDHDHGDNAAVDSDSPMAKRMPGLNDLAPDDFKLAMAQRICPVSGEMLGTMGSPEEVDVNGKSVWICCDGCKEKLLADPDKYLAALKAQGITAPAF
jgi:Cu(I)/Ag(I) efflux system membrane fusion protein